MRLPGPALRAGARDCAPFILIVVPFSVLFGVVARDAGLDVVQAMSMAILVIAGASQFTAIALLQDHAPVFVVLLASLAVNLRMAMYSAALVPHLGHAKMTTRMAMAYLMVDQSFAVAAKKYDEEPGMPRDAKVAYYFGCMAVICPLWYGGCLAGALMGQALPDVLSLDFAVPVCFISLLAPMLRTGPHVLAALVSVTVAIGFAWLPYNLGLIVAAVLAMMAGAQAELWLKRRREASA